MADIVVAPQGKDNIQLGTVIDEAGQRFVGMRFDAGPGDTILVMMPIPLFREFADLAGLIAVDVATRDHWRGHPRG